MADNPPTPPPDEQPDDKRKRSRGPINKKYLDEIDLIRELVVQAQKPERADILRDGEWPADRISALGTKADDLEQAALAAVGRKAARKMDTAQEKTAKKKLIAAISPIRGGAKRKYRNRDDADAGRDMYFVNEPADASLERLLFIADSLLLKLTAPEGGTAEDTLPGVTQRKLDTLKSTHDEYASKDTTQEATESARRQAHQSVVTVYTDAKAERIDLQLAADQGWTFHDPANAAIRRDFKLPPNQSLAG